MRCRAVVTIVILASPSVLLGDESDEVRAFTAKADAEFQRLLPSCKPDRRDYWERRAQGTVEAFNAKSKELQETSALLAREPNAKELQTIFAFRYLNDINEVELTTKTALVEDLGKELLNDKIDETLTPVVASLETPFASPRSTTTNEGLQREYSSFLGLKRTAARIALDTPVKYRYVFRPKSAYATAPEKVLEFTIRDWPSGFAAVEGVRRGLQPIRDALDSALFFMKRTPDNFDKGYLRENHYCRVPRIAHRDSHGGAG